MYDHNPQRPLIAVAPEEKSEDFQTRVLRELAAISERLARLEARLVVKIVPDPTPQPYSGGVVNIPIRRVDIERLPPNLGLKPATVRAIDEDFERTFPHKVNEIGEVIG